MSREAWEEYVKKCRKHHATCGYNEPSIMGTLWAADRLALAEKVVEAASTYKKMIESGFDHDDHAVAVAEDLCAALRELEG